MMPAPSPAGHSSRLHPAGALPMGWARLAIAVTARGILFSILSMLAWAVLPIALGWTPTTVMTGSMVPRIFPGDVVVARPVPSANTNLGQILLVDSPDQAGTLRLHRFVDFAPDGNLVLRGDANPANDSSPVAPAAVRGVAVLRIPSVGLPVVWLAEKNWGALIPVLAAVAGLTVAAASGSGTAGRKPKRRHRGQPRRDNGESPRKRPVHALLAVATIPVLVCTAAMTDTPAHAAFSAATPGRTSSFAALTSFPCLNPARPDNPDLFYAFNEGSGTMAVDASSHLRNGTLHEATRTSGWCGAGASPALSLGGTSGYVSTATRLLSPTRFTVEIWFRTTTQTGGRLMGFGDQPTGPSTTADRHLYMTNAGAVVFAIDGFSGLTTLTSPAGYNDGKWHQVTATRIPSSGLSPSVTTLYIDGQEKATASSLTAASSYQGYWRVGYDTKTTSSGSNASTSAFFAGDLDNAAVYPAALSKTQVQAHYAAGR